MNTNNKQRLFEVMQKVDSTFKPRLFESREYLLDYFKETWSKSNNVKQLVNGNNYMLKKYGQYLEPSFNWDNLDFDQLKLIWDEWSVDEDMINKQSKYDLYSD